MFDRFDILAAYNVYAALFGAESIKARIARIGFQPSRSEERPEGLSENAQDIYLALVLRLEGVDAAEKARREVRPEVGDVTIVVENSDDDPFYVMLTVSDPNAEAWADMDQTIDGSSWEGTDVPSLVYTITSWREGLFDELRAQGYKLDFSQYSEPGEDEIAVMKHAIDCDVCRDHMDFRRAEKHVESQVVKGL